MDATIQERFRRMRDNVVRLEQSAAHGQWDAAKVTLILVNKEAEFIMDWLKAQTDSCAERPVAMIDNWEPPAAPPLENISEPLSGTLDADMPVPR